MLWILSLKSWINHIKGCYKLMLQYDFPFKLHNKMSNCPCTFIFHFAGKPIDQNILCNKFMTNRTIIGSLINMTFTLTNKNVRYNFFSKKNMEIHWILTFQNILMFLTLIRQKNLWNSINFFELWVMHTNFAIKIWIDMLDYFLKCEHI